MIQCEKAQKSLKMKRKINEIKLPDTKPKKPKKKNTKKKQLKVVPLDEFVTKNEGTNENIALDELHWTINPEIFEVSRKIKENTHRLLESLRFREPLDNNRSRYTRLSKKGVCLPFYLKTIEYVNKSQICLFGVGLDNDVPGKTISVMLRIEDFRPYILIEVNEEDKQSWEKSFHKLCEQRTPKPFTFTKFKDSKYQPDISSITYEYRKSTFGFTSIEKGQGHYLAKIACKNDFIRDQLVRYLRTIGAKKAGLEYKIFHEHLTPIEQFILEMLRIPPITTPDPKLFDDRTIPHPFSLNRWFYVYNVYPEKEQISSVQFEAKVSMNDVDATDELKDAPDSLELVFDIETLSHGMRPPNACNSEDFIVTLCCAIVDRSKVKPKAGVWFCLGEVENAGEYEIDGVKIYILCFSTEEEMVTEFVTFWKRTDPDGYVSWNGEKYDLPYLIERLQFYGIQFRFGRLLNEKLESPWKQLQEQGFWAKKGTGQSRPPSIRLSGRQSCDGLPWFPKFQKLKSYSLKKTAEATLKEEPSAPAIVNQQIESFEEDSIQWVKKVLLNTKGNKKLDLDYSKIGPYVATSPFYRFAEAVYCWFDVVLTWRCLRETNCLDFMTQILALTSVDSHAAQTQGQQTLAYHRILQHVGSGHYVLNGDDWKELRPEAYGGGFCFSPHAGQHFMCVIVDFNSLYPTTMTQYCQSYDSLAFTPKMEQTAKELGYKIIELKCEERVYKWVDFPNKNLTLIGDYYKSLFALRSHHKRLKAECASKKDKFGEIYHGLIEQAIKLLMNATYGFTGALTFENSQDKNEQRMTHKSQFWQLAGFFPIAESCTFVGRTNTKLMFDRLGSTGELKCLQGDTDSVFFKAFRGIYQQLCQPFVKEWLEIQEGWKKIYESKLSQTDEKYMAQLEKIKLLDRKVLTKIYDYAEEKKNKAMEGLPLSLEVECLALTLHSTEAKKKYVAYTIVKDEKASIGQSVYVFVEKIKIRGLECVKSDNYPFLKQTMETVINLLVKPTQKDREFGITGILAFPDHPYVEERHIKKIKDIGTYLDQKSFELASGQVSADDLAIPKTIKNEYKKIPIHGMVVKRLAERGEQIEVNSKISILPIKVTRNKDSEQWEELSQIISRNLPINYEWYLKKSLIPAFERLLIIPGLFNRNAFLFMFQNAIRQLPLTMKDSQSITTFFKSKN